MSPTTLQVFDPPMCCPTGSCGPEPDPALARFAADLAWLDRQGVLVERYNLGREPEVFARNPSHSSSTQSTRRPITETELSTIPAGMRRPITNTSTARRRNDLLYFCAFL
jgi:hypothetical protein